ncbi:histone-lysine N-methyltransferase SETMAR [Plakobranchus ocellatus]|uniref:Histone-lysine N-methyltransferase SETMAR n=1 Tax=Plakobranchus ocellatus TaxID=259542 RepID=A0AAV4CFL1_9GAST|nr:histone-lysine N-methyltransferase SETMAR [Plakobranchus ocellatus]
MKKDQAGTSSSLAFLSSSKLSRPYLPQPLLCELTAISFACPPPYPLRVLRRLPRASSAVSPARPPTSPLRIFAISYARPPWSPVRVFAISSTRSPPPSLRILGHLPSVILVPPLRILHRSFSDLAPSDFHLFGHLKRHLEGMAFETEDDLISELRNWFDNLDVDFFRVGINSLLSRWQKCIDLHGDYVEKGRKSELQSV